jgi:hypothetical protein
MRGQDLPPFVHCKRAKGREYFYLAIPSADGSPLRHMRLPHIDAPEFGEWVERLSAQHSLSAPLRAQRRRDRRWVYFIGPDEGPVKIGCGLDPDQRLRDLQLGSFLELRVIAKTPGGRSLEAQYHQRFDEYKVRGEWYVRAPVIAAEIDRLNRSGT